MQLFAIRVVLANGNGKYSDQGSRFLASSRNREEASVLGAE